MDGLGSRKRSVFECFFVGDFLRGVLITVEEEVSIVCSGSGVVMRRGRLPAGIGIVTIFRRVGIVSADEDEGVFSNVSLLLAFC